MMHKVLEDPPAVPDDTAHFGPSAKRHVGAAAPCENPYEDPLHCGGP